MNKGIRKIDVLECQSEALIYSTNVFLNCSGGVGGCLLKKYGPRVQETLHGYLAKTHRKHADQGEVVELVLDIMPYKNVFHTVPCNGFYDTDSAIVSRILRETLERCLQQNIQTVAMSAIATGYGHYDRPQFFRVAANVLNEESFSDLQISICLDHDFGYDEARDQIVAENLALNIE